MLFEADSVPACRPASCHRPRKAIELADMKANQIIIAFYEQIIKIKKSEKKTHSNKAKLSEIFKKMSYFYIIYCLKRNTF